VQDFEDDGELLEDCDDVLTQNADNLTQNADDPTQDADAPSNPSVDAVSVPASIAKDDSLEAFKNIAKLSDIRTPEQKAKDVEDILDWGRSPQDKDFLRSQGNFRKIVKRTSIML